MDTSELVSNSIHFQWNIWNVPHAPYFQQFNTENLPLCDWMREVAFFVHNLLPPSYYSSDFIRKAQSAETKGEMTNNNMSGALYRLLKAFRVPNQNDVCSMRCFKWETLVYLSLIFFSFSIANCLIYLLHSRDQWDSIDNSELATLYGILEPLRTNFSNEIVSARHTFAHVLFQFHGNCTLL